MGVNHQEQRKEVDLYSEIKMYQQKQNEYRRLEESTLEAKANSIGNHNFGSGSHQINRLPDDIGTYIRELRQSRNIGLKRLSKRIGYSGHTYLAHIEKGRSSPSDDFIDKFSEELALSRYERGLLLYLAGKRNRVYHTDTERKLAALFEGVGIIVGAYARKLSEADIREISDVISKIRQRRDI